MKKLLVALIFLVCQPLYSQQTHDFRNDVATFPFAERDYLPGSCQTGQYARLTTTNLMYRCDSPNAWSVGFKAGSTVTGHGIPPASTCTVGHVGDIYSRDDAGAASSTLYVCANTAPATYVWELAGSSGGSGTVTSVATGCGTSGGTITTTGTVIATEPVNAQTGTTYTYQNGDCGKLVTHTNTSAIAGTLPQANGSTFIAGWFMDVENRGAGTLTITPTTSTIDGAATLALTTDQGARIVSNGTNYFTQRGMGGGGGTPGTPVLSVQSNQASAFSGNADFIQNNSAISAPAAPTLAKVGTGTGTTWGYTLVAGIIGTFQITLGSAPSSQTTISGNATLDMTHSITITPPACSGGVTGYDVWRTTPNDGMIGHAACGISLSDIGQSPTYFSNWEGLPGGDFSIGVGITTPLVAKTVLVGTPLSNVPMSPPDGGLLLVGEYAFFGSEANAQYQFSHIVTNQYGVNVEFDSDWVPTVDIPSSSYGMITFVGSVGGSHNFTSSGGHNVASAIWSLFTTNGISGDSLSGSAQQTANLYLKGSLGRGTVNEYADIWIGPETGGGTIGTNYGLYENSKAGFATNNYYSWFDSQGVGRCKEDATFDMLGQSICAVYNPQFTKYTPGAVDYERITYGQWNGNVAEIGTEKGGAGTLRELRLNGQDVQLPVLAFASLATPAARSEVYCSDCTVTSAVNNVCAGSGTGAFAYRVGTSPAWKCQQ